MKLKKFIPNSLYSRFLLIIAIPVLIVQLVSIYVFFYYHIDNISKHMARSIVSEIIFIKENAKNKDYQEYLSKLSKTLKIQYKSKKISNNQEKNQNYINYFAKFKYINPIINPYNQFKKELSKHTFTKFKIKPNKNNKKTIILEIYDQNNIISFQIHKKRIYNSSQYVFTLWMVLTAIITLYISLIFLKNQIKSIKILSATAEKIGKGFNSQEIKVSGPKETRSLAISFKKMLRV